MLNKLIEAIKILKQDFAEDVIVARFVGGCVRKHLTSDVVDDIDIATTLSTDEIKDTRGTLTSPGKDSPWRDHDVNYHLNL